MRYKRLSWKEKLEILKYAEELSIAYTKSKRANLVA